MPTTKDEIMNATRRKKLMAAIEKRREVIRTQVQAVAQGYTTALFLHGPGGLGKTHIVTTELDALCGAAWVHHTAYSTPRALIMSIVETPEAIHVFEDCEKLYKTDVAASILRAACGAPRGKDRWVTYETANERIRVNFRGGIIIVSNENLAKAKGPLAAVASRFRPVKWDLTTEERIASILDLADQGWSRGEHDLDVAACRRVARFLVDEMTSGRVDHAVDLRTFVEHALPAYAQFLTEDSGANWKDVLRSKLAGEVTHEEKRIDKTKRLEDLALSIDGRPDLKNTKERVKFWTETTGLGQAIYYRHLKNARRKTK